MAKVEVAEAVAFRRLYRNGLSTYQIAEVTGRSRPTVSRRVSDVESEDRVANPEGVEIADVDLPNPEVFPEVEGNYEHLGVRNGYEGASRPDSEPVITETDETETEAEAEAEGEVFDYRFIEEITSGDRAARLWGETPGDYLDGIFSEWISSEILYFDLLKRYCDSTDRIPSPRYMKRILNDALGRQVTQEDLDMWVIRPYQKLVRLYLKQRLRPHEVEYLTQRWWDVDWLDLTGAAQESGGGLSGQNSRLA